jgi:hypothetical protein
MPPQVPAPAIPNPLAFMGAASIESVLAVVITLVFIWWAIYSFVVVYHWVKYSRDNMIAVPALVAHFAVSAWIFVFATGGFH